MAKSNNKIIPITMPGVHPRVNNYLKGIINNKDHRDILDVGAGYGAFSKILHENGYNVSACDIYPEDFLYKEVECLGADITKKLPYPDNSFNVVLAVEVMEHIHDHQDFFQECYRVLREDGMLIFSTPNIMSLKSRIRFLFSGYFYAFKPLDHKNNDGLQHVASLTIDQYANLSVRSGFKSYEISIDKKQKSSLWLSFLVPFIRLSCKLKKIEYAAHNRYDYLTGRLLFFRVSRNN